MQLNALAICCPDPLLEKIVPVFHYAGIETDVCLRAEDAWERLLRAKYDAAVVDLERSSGWHDGMGRVRKAGPNRGSVIFAVRDANTSPSDACRAGASLVLDRDFSQNALLKSLRALHGAMLSERQRYYRCPIEIPVSIAPVGTRTPAVRAVSSNVSRGGMAVRCPFLPSIATKVEVEFQVPGTLQVNCEAQVVWSDGQGRGGLVFTRMSQRMKEQFIEWLKCEWERTHPAPFPIPLTLPKESMAGRSLKCHAFIKQLPVAWKCSGCGWIGSIPVEASSWRFAAHPPGHVVEAFERHTCNANIAPGT